MYPLSQFLSNPAHEKLSEKKPWENLHAPSSFVLRLHVFKRPDVIIHFLLLELQKWPGWPAKKNLDNLAQKRQSLPIIGHIYRLQPRICDIFSCLAEIMTRQGSSKYGRASHFHGNFTCTQHGPSQIRAVVSCPRIQGSFGSLYVCAMHRPS
jgi:hypothetical protein